MMHVMQLSSLRICELRPLIRGSQGAMPLEPDQRIDGAGFSFSVALCAEQGRKRVFAFQHHRKACWALPLLFRFAGADHAQKEAR